MRTSRPGWFDLPRDERRAVLSMLWLVPALHVAVRLFDYQRTRGWLMRSAARSAESSRSAATRPRVEALRLASARVEQYSRLPGNCLSRSLALFWLLRRAGYDAELQLGVSLAGGAFAAHAWVVSGGRVLNDTEDVATRYAPLRSTGSET
jgi:hypothetical protein